MKKPAKEPPRGQASMWTQLLIPLAALVRGDLLALVHQLGMQAFASMLEAERTKLCGQRYKHDAARHATRAGSARGELALGGRRIAVRRPRVADREGHEVPLDTWSELASTDPLGMRALEQMAIGVAMRKYARSLEVLPEGIETRGTSKSSVSRRFVALTTEKLAEWMARQLGDLDIWAVFIDGIHSLVDAPSSDARERVRSDRVACEPRRRAPRARAVTRERCARSRPGGCGDPQATSERFAGR